jgi:hypothetical protein
MIEGRARLRTRTVWYGSLALLVSFMLRAIGQGAFREGYFDSDDLYLPVLFEDLTRWSGHWSDWRLTPAPYFFPDMPLYAVARVATGSIEWAQYLSGCAQLLLFGLFARHLVDALVSRACALSACIAPIMLGLFWLFWSGELPLFGALLRLTNHGGAALMSVIAVWFCLRRADGQPGATVRRSRVLTTASAFVWSALGGLSDPLFAASCGGPLVVIGAAAALPWCWQRLCDSSDPGRRTTRDRALACGIGSLIGAALTRQVHAHMNFLPAPVRHLTPFDLTLIALGDLAGPAWQTGLLLMAGVAMSGIALVVCRGADARGTRLLAFWQIGSTVATVAALAFEGGYLDTGSLRYVVVPYVMTIVTGFVVVAPALRVRVSKPFRDRLLALASSAVVVALTAAAVTQASSLPGARYTSDWRGTVRCVGALAQREQADVVLADYSIAKPIRLFSDNKLKALQMRAKLGRPSFWINSRGWYRGPLGFGIVVVNELKPDSIRSKFGAPARIEQCGELELFVYRDAGRAKLARVMNKMFENFVRDPHPR